MRIVFYTKPNCHLCDVVKFELLDLQEEYNFALDERNILSDGTLQEEFRMIIPVVDVWRVDAAHPERLQAPISQLALRRAVRAAAAQEQSEPSAGADR